MQMPSLDQHSLKWTEAKRETVLYSDEPTVELVLKTMGTTAFVLKWKRAIFLLSVHRLKACISDVMGVH